MYIHIHAVFEEAYYIIIIVNLIIIIATHMYIHVYVFAKLYAGQLAYHIVSHHHHSNVIHPLPFGLSFSECLFIFFLPFLDSFRSFRWFHLNFGEINHGLCHRTHTYTHKIIIKMVIVCTLLAKTTKWIDKTCHTYVALR